MTTAVASDFARAPISRTTRGLAAVVLLLGLALLVLSIAPPARVQPQLAAWLGGTVATTHAIPTVLGAETFSSPGASTVPYGWLGDVIVYTAEARLGSTGLLLFGSVSLFAALAMLYARCRALSLHPPYVAGALAVATLATLGTSLRNPALLNWAFLGAALLALESRDRRRSRAVIPIAFVWCNLDPVGLLASIATLLFAIGTLAEERRFGSASKHAAMLVAGTALATLTTPWGLALLTHAPAALALDPALHAVVMWQSPGVHKAAYTFGFIALIIVAALSGALKRSKPPEILMTLGAGLLTLCNAVYLPVFAFVAAPIVARAVQSGFAEMNSTARPRWIAHVASFAAVACILASVWLAAAQRPDLRPSSQLVARIAADRRPHRVFCMRIADCDSVVAGGMSSLRVFMDGRAGAYPERVRRDQVALAGLHPGWRELLRTWRIDTIVLPRQSAFAAVLHLLPDRWHAAASDGTFDVYERDRR